MNNTQVQQFSFFAQHGYRYKLYLDDLPSATMIRDQKNRTLVPDYMQGIPVGEYDRVTKKLKIYNHLQITVKVHKANTVAKDKRIVGFEVHAMSRDPDDKHTLICDHTAQYDPFYLEANKTFTWTYCIRTEVSYSSLSLRLTPSFFPARQADELGPPYGPLLQGGIARHTLAAAVGHCWHSHPRVLHRLLYPE